MLNNSAFCTYTKIEELECIEIMHPKFEALICLQGAQLTRFKHSEHGDLLWLSPQAQYKKGASVRGGIPICWPWFGALEFNPAIVRESVKTPINSNSAHGFARELPWELIEVQESVHGVEISLQLRHNKDTLKIWPYEFELTCHFKLADTIAIQLRSKNLSPNAMAISQALHTYLPTSDISNTRVLGAGDGQYIDALDEWQLKKQHGSINFNQEVDRIYLGDNQYRILTPKKHLTLSSNSQSSIVWNPWIKKSQRLSQFPNNGYKKMLCIESANVLSDHLKLNQGETHSLNMSLSSLS